MNKFRKGVRGASAIGLAAAVSLSMMPVGSAFAMGSLQSWQPPSAKTSNTAVKGGVTKTYITSASHKASEGIADILGISNVTASPNAANPYAWNKDAESNYYGYDDPVKGSHVSGISENARFGIFGSDVNEAPNPYYANYFYNAYQKARGNTDLVDDKDVLLLDTTSGHPLVADTTIIDAYGTSAALHKRPDILLAAGVNPGNVDLKDKDGKIVYSGEALSTASGYTDLVNKIRNKELGSYEGEDLYQAGDENYNPYYVTFSINDYSTCLRTLYNLADSANAIMKRDSSKTTRYGDPEKIAQKFEGYLLGTQDYVLKAIDQKKVSKKTVAVVKSVDTVTNTVTLATNDDNTDGGALVTSSLQNVTENLADKLGKTTVTASELMGADKICVASYIGMANSLSTDPSSKKIQDGINTVLKNGGYTDESKYPETFVQGPKTVIHAKKGATDGVPYVGALIGFVYPELINPVDSIAYFYQNFYHVKESRLADAMGLNLAAMSLPSGAELSLSNYSQDKYQAVINEGLAYYGANKAAIDSAYPTLASSDRLVLPQDLSKAKVTLSKSRYTYDGKAKTPAVTVVLDGKTLARGTDYSVSYKSNKNAGTAKAMVTGIGNYANAKSTSFKIGKATGYAKANKKSVAAKKGGKFTINASGTVKLSVSKTAKAAGVGASGKTVTFKKGIKKGTYKVTAKVAASKNYKAASKVITLKAA